MMEGEEDAGWRRGNKTTVSGQRRPRSRDATAGKSGKDEHNCIELEI